MRVRSLIADLVKHHVALTSTLTVFETFVPGRPLPPGLDVLEPQLRAQFEKRHTATAANTSSPIGPLFGPLNRPETWELLADCLYHWDAHIQDTLAAESETQSSAYQLGRGLAEAYWAYPGAADGEPGSWSVLLGEQRRAVAEDRAARGVLPTRPPRPAAGSLQVWGGRSWPTRAGDSLRRRRPAAQSDAPLAFVKMVHNGIEYGIMAAYAEGLDILRNADVGARWRMSTTPRRPRWRRRSTTSTTIDTAEVAEVWRRGSVVGSWLLDLTATALLEDPDLAGFSGRVSDSGEGRWTALAAVEEGVPAYVLTASLFERFSSRNEGEFANRLLSAMRKQFGGHAEKTTA